MKVHIKYIYYYKFETKLLLITNKKLWKLRESKFIHMMVNGGDCNIYAHSSLWMRPTRPDRYNSKMVYRARDFMQLYILRCKCSSFFKVSPFEFFDKPLNSTENGLRLPLTWNNQNVRNSILSWMGRIKTSFKIMKGNMNWIHIYW